MKITAAIALLLAMTAPTIAQDSVLYRGGPIVTMDVDTPITVEAVVTKGDRIAFVGDEAGARAAAGKDATIHDLHGATMLPGFVDSHSHFSPKLQMASGLGLADRSLPPVTDIAHLQAAPRGCIDARAIQAGGGAVRPE